MSRMLIVGGTGFLGSHLCSHFSAHDHQVHSLSRTQTDSPVANVSYHLANLSDIDDVRSALGGERFDFVINCGGKVDHRQFSNGGDEVIAAHYNGLHHFLQVLDKSSIKRFVQIGSSDQYGAAGAPQSEELREAPISPYSFAKTAADHFLQMLWRTEGFPAVSFRLFLIYGPGQHRARFIPQIVEGCLEKRSFKVSPGLQSRDFCYISDVVEAISRSLDNDAANGEVFNLASGQAVMIRQVVERIREIAGGGDPEFGALPYRSGESMALVANIEKISRVLDWRPSVSLDEGLHRTVNYFRDRTVASGVD